MRLIALEDVRYPQKVLHRAGESFDVESEDHARLLTAGVKPKARRADDAEARTKRQYRRRDMVAEG